MNTGQDLVSSMFENSERVKMGIDERFKAATKRAKAEYEYRKTLHEEMTEAKANGMAATALYDYCRGIERVAKKRLEREFAQIQEEYCDGMIYYYKTEIRIAEGQLSAERKGL